MSDFESLVAQEITTLLDTYDENKDGVITKEEAIAYFKKRGAKYPERSTVFLFKTYDTDKDGKITTAEIKADASKRIGEELRKKTIETAIQEDIETFLLKNDVNKDKKVERDELLKVFTESGSKDPKASVDWTFNELDTDKDGVITVEEIRKYSTKVQNLLNPSQ